MNPFHNRRVFLVVAIILAAASVTCAQSGRRSTNPSTTTTPSVSGQKTVEKAPVKAPKLQLFVGVEDRNLLMNVPYYLSDSVLDNCVRRLNEAEEIDAKPSGRRLSRGDAISRAKAEKEAYVVWLQIESDIDSSRQMRNGPDELYVRYTIFEPVTAKIKQWGRTQQQIYRVGRVGVSGPTKNSPLYSEYALRQAAKEAADHVAEAFQIKSRD